MPGTGVEPTAEFYETILTNIRDGVYALDSNGRITWVNDVAIAEFDGGYDREDLVGAHVSKILPPEDIEACVDHIGDLLSGEKESARCEVTLLTASGDPVPTELHLVLLPDDDGGFRGTVGVARNISARKRREQYVTVLNRILRHNLRNDLNVILGHADNLSRDETLANGHREDVAVIRDVAEDLIRLSEKVQTLKTLLERDNDAYPVGDCVDRIETLCRQYEDAHPDARIETSAPDSAPVRGIDVLEYAVDNLLENAVTHTDRDSPTVHVEITPIETDEEVEILVVDDGPGIPDHEVQTLNRRDESPLEHGSGIGLWIVSWIVSTLDGSVTFTNADASGTAVRLRIPAP